MSHSILKQVLCAAVVVLLGVWSSNAQTDPVSPVPPDSTPTTPTTPTIEPVQKIEPREGRTLLQEKSGENIGTTASVRPERPERPVLSPEVARKLREFQIRRENYLKEREAFVKRYRGATEAERIRLRLRFQEEHERWQQYNTEFRENAVERQKELINRFPDRPLLDAVRERVRDTRDPVIKERRAIDR